MPYIKQSRRQLFDETLDKFYLVLQRNPKPNGITAGDLNYTISQMLNLWLLKNGTNYDNLNAIHGVLSCLDKEFYRRVTSIYEDKKIQENGDVFTMPV